MFWMLGCTANQKKEIPEPNNKIEKPKTENGNSSENEKTEDKTSQNDGKPTSEDMKESFTIDIGDGKHSFKVIMEARPFEEGENDEFYDSVLNISIYDVNDMSSPVQVIEDKHWIRFLKIMKQSMPISTDIWIFAMFITEAWLTIIVSFGFGILRLKGLRNLLA